MCGKPDKAIHWLRRCVEMGLPNSLLFGSDPHLRSLHNQPAYFDLMGEMRRQHEEFCAEFGSGPGPPASW
jgi:hypothetical protein